MVVVGGSEVRSRVDGKNRVDGQKGWLRGQVGEAGVGKGIEGDEGIEVGRGISIQIRFGSD
jgi:hypothetical protein